MIGRIAASAIRTSAVLGLRLVVQAGSLLLVARLLGPQQFGTFAGVAALAVLLGTLATFGTHLVLIGEMAKDPARRVQVLAYAMPTTLVCGGILLAAFLSICAQTLPGTTRDWHSRNAATAAIALGGGKAVSTGAHGPVAVVANATIALALGRCLRSICSTARRYVGHVRLWILHCLCHRVGCDCGVPAPGLAASQAVAQAVCCGVT